MEERVKRRKNVVIKGVEIKEGGVKEIVVRIW